MKKEMTSKKFILVSGIILNALFFATLFLPAFGEGYSITFLEYVELVFRFNGDSPNLLTVLYVLGLFESLLIIIYNSLIISNRLKDWSHIKKVYKGYIFILQFIIQLSVVVLGLVYLKTKELKLGFGFDLYAILTSLNLFLIIKDRKTYFHISETIDGMNNNIKEDEKKDSD